MDSPSFSSFFTGEPSSAVGEPSSARRNDEAFSMIDEVEADMLEISISSEIRVE